MWAHQPVPRTGLQNLRRETTASLEGHHSECHVTGSCGRLLTGRVSDWCYVCEMEELDGWWGLDSVAQEQPRAYAWAKAEWKGWQLGILCVYFLLHQLAGSFAPWLAVAALMCACRWSLVLNLSAWASPGHSLGGDSGYRSQELEGPGKLQATCSGSPSGVSAPCLLLPGCVAQEDWLLGKPLRFGVLSVIAAGVRNLYNSTW